MLSTRIWRAFLRRLLGMPKSQLTRRLRVELLEDRVVPATVTWVNTGSGDWNVGSNWSSGTVPGGGNTVVINTTATATITVSSGYEFIQSLSTAATDTLAISGGIIIPQAGTSTLNGPLSISSGKVEATGLGHHLHRQRNDHRHGWLPGCRERRLDRHARADDVHIKRLHPPGRWGREACSPCRH